MVNERRDPYVGEGADGCRRSAEIDRAEADTCPTGGERWQALQASARRWEQQADEIEAAGDSPPDVFRDVPSHVRDMVREASELLGIPPGEVASVWLAAGWRDALDRYRRFVADVDDKSRIRGWMPSGCPLLDEVPEAAWWLPVDQRGRKS